MPPHIDQPFSRRTLLGGAAAGAGGLVLAGDSTALAKVARRRTRYARTPLAKGVKYGQGVSSGQPSTSGITLWTRVEGVDRTSRLQVEVSPDEDFRRIVARNDVLAEQARDFTIHTRVSRGLRPGEQYFYRFYTCMDENSQVGRFRTARPSDSREPVRIGFFSCQEYDSGFYTAHAALAREADLDLVIGLGDYIYERVFDRNPIRSDTTGANRDGEVQTLPEYHQKYNLYNSDPNLIAMRASHPMMAIWDDHEVEDNYARDKPGEATKQVRVPFLQRQRNGYDAFFNHMPRIRVKSDPDQIFGRIGLGGSADVFLLDQRRFRDDQACGDEFAVPCGEQDDPGRTLLGADQKRWLLDGLAGSRATWKVIGNQVMIMALDVPRGNPLNPDQWDGYAAERAELLNFIGDRGVKDVAFVTGDIHTFFTGNVSPTGRQSELRQPASVATEFVGGSITTKGIFDAASGERGRDAAALPSDESVYINNPHIRFSNQSVKGYGVLEASSEELRVAYRGVRTTQSPESEAFTLAEFRVARGRPEVEVVRAPTAGPQPLPL